MFGVVDLERSAFIGYIYNFDFGGPCRQKAWSSLYLYLGIEPYTIGPYFLT